MEDSSNLFLVSWEASWFPVEEEVQIFLEKVVQGLAIGQDLGAQLASAAFPLDDAAKDLATKDIQSWTAERR